MVDLISRLDPHGRVAQPSAEINTDYTEDHNDNPMAEGLVTQRLEPRFCASYGSADGKATIPARL